MAIRYCDWLTGNDATGDGSNTTPYKTIDRCCTDLSGPGDEVRVARSPAAVDLSGTATFTFTKDSTTVAASASVFVDAVSGNENDASVRRGDFIQGYDNNWWEVVTVTTATQATLFQKYSGDTQSGVNSYKLRVTDTGAASGSTAVIQAITKSGSSGNVLQVSGGWTLATPAQDGETYFRQIHGTFTTRAGYALQLSGRSFVDISKLHFLRYSRGVNLISFSNNNTITTPMCNGNGDGISFTSSYSNTITTPTCNSNTRGILFSSSYNNTITTPICNSNSSNGISFSSSYNNTITTPICNSNSSNGISFSSSNNNTITTPTCNGNGDGINFSSSYSNTITTPTCNGNTRGILFSSSYNNTITTPTCNGNGDGISFSSSYSNTITTPTCNSNSWGLLLTAASNNNTITTPTCNSNSSSGIVLARSFGNVCQSYSGTGNGDDITVQSADVVDESPMLSIQKFKTSGDNRNYFNFGVSRSNTSEARSNTCLQYTPASTTHYMSHSFYFAVNSGIQKTLSAYIKKDGSFDGDVQGAIFFLGVKITGWTAITPSTTAYEQKSLVASSSDITETGVLELRIKVRGTAGNIYVDDLGIE